MKKVLFATTALVFSAGIAAAEVSVGGDGRMGVVYNGSDWNFSSRIRVSFTASGTTDGGLEFGGSMRADQASGAKNGTAASVYISGAFGKLSMGDVVGAPEALFGDLPEVGYTDLDGAGLSNVTALDGRNNLGANEIPYLTGDNGGNVVGNDSNSGPNLLYTGTFGAFSVAASMSDGKDVSTSVNQEYAVAGAYTFGNYTVGLGYEIVDPTTGSNAKQAMISGVAQFGNTSVKAYYADGSGSNNLDKGYGIGATSVFGATSVMAYVNYAKADDGTDGTTYGLGAAYDLGGGASIVGGVADSDIANTDTQADLGVKFKF
ncbi:porin [Thioclava nitratireducens]|uniref:porin n=1 Tax=Thioclava nitratireducens TaxID=1915078 RepID=UPI00247FAAAA|nr:porin [Thioclava nitratireducens]WGT48714.1 porin [Thioclava nitratireducens]